MTMSSVVTMAGVKSIPHAVALPLSGFMIFIALLTFITLPFGSGPSWPLLTTIRDPRVIHYTHLLHSQTSPLTANLQSGLNILAHRALHTPPWIYKGGKGLAAVLWSLLIPLQHTASLRRRRPDLHRTGGWIVIGLSTILGLAGYYMQLGGMVTTHEKWYHIHTLQLQGMTLLAWPTFSVATGLLGIVYFGSLAKLIMAIRAGDVPSHSRWATFHSMTGYAISIERIAVLIVFALGCALHLLPDHVGTWLGLPKDPEGMYHVELAALAWTLSVAGGVVAGWSYWVFGRDTGAPAKRVEKGR